MSKIEIKDPVTGQSYSLEHLNSFEVTYKVRVDDAEVAVPVQVLFDNHCYTRSRESADPGSAVLYRERRRDGSIEERVFCVKRWTFSQQLPAIIRDLHSKGCLSGRSREIIYRQEGATPQGSHAGWYLCIRLGVSQKHGNMTLSVRSCHWRSNRPIDVVRGAPRRFYVLLAAFYKAERHKLGNS